MVTINPGLAVLLLVLGIVASAAAGVYVRNRLRKSVAVGAGMSVCMQLVGMMLLLMLMMSFAASGLHMPMFVAMCVTSAVIASLIWGANPTREELEGEG